MARLREMGVVELEHAYDAQAGVLAESPPERRRHLLRRVLQWSIEVTH